MDIGVANDGSVVNTGTQFREGMRVEAGACHFTIAQGHALVTDRGQRFSIDVRTMVANHSRDMLVLGEQAADWSRFAEGRIDSLFLGVSIDRSGHVHAVPAPLGARKVIGPRGTLSRRGGWDVVFVEAFGAIGPFASDSAIVWFGRYDGGKWQDVAPILMVHGAMLDTDLSSELLRVGDDLAFVFGIGRHRNRVSSAVRRGIIVVKGRPGLWRTDTLPLSFDPTNVQASVDPNGRSLVIGFVSWYATFQPQTRINTDGVFLTSYDSVWHPVVRIGGDGEHGVNSLRMIRVGNEMLTSWAIDDNRRGGIEAFWSGRSRTDSVPQRILDDVGPFFEVAAWDSSTVSWILNTANRDTLSIVTHTRRGLLSNARIFAPNVAFAPRAVALSSSALMLFTFAPAADSATPGLTIANVLSRRCTS